MLKNLMRIGMILLVCGLLAAGIYSLVEANSDTLTDGNLSGPDNGLRGNPLETGTGELTTTDKPAGGARQGGPPGDHEHGGEAGIGRSLLGIARNLITIALFTLVVAGLQKLSKMIFRQKPAQAV